MASFRQALYHFKGETIRVNYWKDTEGKHGPPGDRTCYVAQTRYGGTETVCKLNAREAKDIVLAQARLKIKKAQKSGEYARVRSALGDTRR